MAGVSACRDRFDGLVWQNRPAVDGCELRLYRKPWRADHRGSWVVDWGRVFRGCYTLDSSLRGVVCLCEAGAGNLLTAHRGRRMSNHPTGANRSGSLQFGCEFRWLTMWGVRAPIAHLERSAESPVPPSTSRPSRLILSLIANEKEARQWSG
jgi:hypothetical protein